MPDNLYGNDIPTTDIILQAFYWDAMIDGKIGGWYKHLLKRIPIFVELNFSLLWLPPPSKSRRQSYTGYTPMDYYDLGKYQQKIQIWNNLTLQHEWIEHKGKETLYGRQKELIELLKKLKSQGIKAIADIVLNHREAQQFNEEFELLRWKGSKYSIASKKMAWGYKTNDPTEITSNDGGTAKDDGEGGFSPNVAHENETVRKELKEWLQWIKDDIGFEGWRYDYVKGYAPKWIGEYNYHTNPYISIGEYYDGNANLIYGWIDSSDSVNEKRRSMAFDFPLYYHLKAIFRGEKAFNLLHEWQDPERAIIGGWAAKAVTFLDNHDTIRSERDKFAYDDKRLVQGYVFILTHPGIPCVFWAHIFERYSGYAFTKIRALCRFRVAQKITNQSVIKIIETKNNLYVATVDERVIVKIGDGSWNPSGRISGNWNSGIKGRGWSLWTKS